MLLQAAAAAPDHGRLRPTRFIALRGEAKDAFGAVLERGYVERCRAAGAEPEPALAQKERTKLGRAPLVLVAATLRHGQRPRPAAVADRIPWEERRMSTAAAVQNVLLAATALGYGAMWRTGDPARDPIVKEALGLGSGDEIAGFIYLGTEPADTPPMPPNRPDTGGILTHWRAEGQERA